MLRRWKMGGLFGLCVLYKDRTPPMVKKACQVFERKMLQQAVSLANQKRLAEYLFTWPEVK